MKEEDIRRFLEVAREKFICLRCGECCVRWQVRMPDGSRKPEGQSCRYLVPRKIKKSEWQEASCTIHNDSEYPSDCYQAVFGIGVCPLGIAIWSYEKEQKPSVRLPRRVKKFLPSSKEENFSI